MLKVTGSAARHCEGKKLNKKAAIIMNDKCFMLPSLFLFISSF
jgi:hypothetical protein